VARADSGVMKEFREKARITNRAIQMRRDRLLDLVQMPPEIATYVAAQQAGVQLNKYLDEPTLRTVAEYGAMVRAASPGGQAPVPRPQPSKPSRKSRGADEFKLPNVTVPPGTLSQRTQNDAWRMAQRVYPLLYVFENSAREFVDGHLTAKYGKDWWDEPGLVGKSARDALKRNREAQDRNRWVERKNQRPVYYTELGHLADIITSEKGWKVFRPIFDDQSWVKSHVRAFELPRNIVAHMNVLLEKNIKGLEVRAQEWFDQVKDHPPPGP
jgi:hypothetical protein